MTKISQVVIFIAEWQSRKMDPRFPVGQARLETLGVLLCALIMALASVQVKGPYDIDALVSVLFYFRSNVLTRPSNFSDSYASPRPCSTLFLIHHHR